MNAFEDNRGIGEQTQLPADGAQAPGHELQQDLAGDAESSVYVGDQPQARSRAPMLLGLLLLVLAGVIYFMYFKHAPQEASAAQGNHTQAARTTIDQFLNSGGDNIRQMEQLLQNTEKVVQQFKSYPSIAQVPISDLKDNPFRHANPTQADASQDDEAGRRRRAEERQQVLRAVQQLQLQSIMHGESRRACMINNAMYTEGQQIDQFTIDRITPDTVVVRSGQQRFELKMVH